MIKRRYGFASLCRLFLLSSVVLIYGCGGSSANTTANNPGATDNTETTDGGTTDGGTTDGGTTAEPAKPNFLLIITDDQGLDASAQYSLSNDLPNTPVVDQLAADGIVFDNVWATPSCTTTRGSLITGKHGVNSGVDRTPSLMDTSILTLQSHLASASYANAVFGKWHLAGSGADLTHPNASGVEHYAGNIAGVIDDYSNWSLTMNGAEEQLETEYHTTAVTNMAIDWIGEQTGPWFTWVAYVAPHSPFHLPPSELHNRSLPGDAADINSNPRQYYLAAIEAMDTEIGRLLQSVPQEALENTVVMVLGDNGTPRAVLDTTAFPDSHGKGSLFEGGIRVPFVVSGAGVSRRNEREAALLNSVDIFPTLSEAAGVALPSDIDGQSFQALLSSSDASSREFNYSEFISNRTSGWTVRDSAYKLIEYADGSRALYDLRTDIREENDLIDQAQLSSRVAALDTYARETRNETTTEPPVMTEDPIDITNAILQNTRANCGDYAAAYSSTVLDVNNGQQLMGNLQVEVSGGNCIFTTNAIPNHDLNDGTLNFANPVSAQNDTYTITASPAPESTSTPLSLTQDNAILLNGVKVDLLAAACFGVGNGRIGCNDPNQPWRYDPMHAPNGFRVDTHNAHTQPDGTYHYHGLPNALFDGTDGSQASPLVGFAADGFPIFGSYFNDNGTVRKATSSYRLKTPTRPDSAGNPGGTPDGTYRDDYEFVEGLGNLDTCNGMTVNGVYGYYMIEQFPYILTCFTGKPDDSFLK